MDYTVTFEYVVQATSPDKAAQVTFEWITDPSGVPPIATVTAPDGTSQDIDLEIADEGGE